MCTYRKAFGASFCFLNPFWARTTSRSVTSVMRDLISIVWTISLLTISWESGLRLKPNQLWNIWISLFLRFKVSLMCSTCLHFLKISLNKRYWLLVRKSRLRAKNPFFKLFHYFPFCEFGQRIQKIIFLCALYSKRFFLGFHKNPQLLKVLLNQFLQVFLK